MGLGVFVGENVAHYFFAPCNCYFSSLKNVGKNAHTDMIADGQATEQSKCLTRKKKLFRQLKNKLANKVSKYPEQHGTG